MNVTISQSSYNKSILNQEKMITPLFLSIPPGTTYEQLKHPLKFADDYIGVTTWVMRLPRVVYSVDLKIKHTFNEGTVEMQYVNNPSLQEKWKYFVITKGCGKKYYCTAQTYYEKSPIKCKEKTIFGTIHSQKYKEFYLPKCLVLLSELPYYKLQVNMLKIYRQLKKAEPIISYSINETFYKIYLHMLENGRAAEWEYLNIYNREHQTRIGDSRVLAGDRKITCSTEFTFNYYLNCCNEHRNGQAIYLEKTSNRQVLHLYKLYPNTLYQICYVFHLPFSSNTLRIILSAILSQKQIIFVCGNPNLNTLIIQTLMQMIMPLRWCHMYVPNLPVHLIEAAQQSFMPYIIGVSKKSLSLIDCSNKVVVNVEDNSVNYGSDLKLFHNSMEEYLAYSNNETRNYLEWEKQIRIKSILLISALIEPSLGLAPEDIDSYIQYRKKAGDHQFYREFILNSMMYKKLKEDVGDQLNKEMARLLFMTQLERKNFLVSKFNILYSQTQYPIRYDNEKNWIRYYERVTRNRRKLKFNRSSLNTTLHDRSLYNLSLHDSTIVTTNSIHLGGKNSVVSQSTLIL